jgi:hypothetical protein
MNKDRLNPNRRSFLSHVGVAGAATVAAGIVGAEPLLKTVRSSVQAAPTSNQRANSCAKVRRDAAQTGLQSTPSNLQHPSNNDESLYPNKIGSFSKGLPHNNDGTVDLNAYNAFPSGYQ